VNAQKLQGYHKLFTSEIQNYYKQGNAVQGEWQGELAAKYGLAGPVGATEFARLSEGQHPVTQEQLVQHRTPQQQVAADGTVTNAVAHRAGWDGQIAPPKSVSLTALVGGDHRVREAHDQAVTAALTELERYTQARIGGNHAAETTGKFIAAKFVHDTARPVDGYAAPQLHTHVILFNVTERADGSTRALQPQSLFDTQNFVTAVYQSALTHQLRNLGYELEEGRSGAPEIKGYSQAYLNASSLRSQQIRERLQELGLSGPAAAQFAAYATRSSKQELSAQEVLEAHRKLAADFGNQPARVVAEARQRALTQQRAPDYAIEARQAISYARAHAFEREAVIDQRGILRDALRRGMGETTYTHIKAEFDRRRENGEFLPRPGKKHDTGVRFTTPETIAAERANIAHVVQGQNAAAPIMTREQAQAQAATRSFLNPAQRRVIEEVLTSPDRIHGLQGLAGTGKTTVLSSIREGAERHGYKVEGFAPSSKAASQLREAGIEAATLQSFLVRGGAAASASPHLYMLDESSLASTQQMKQFLDKLKPQDRVLVIGDTRQHQGVDAGKPFEQMQQAGMRTSRLDTIMRQKDPELLKAVEQLARGNVAEGVTLLGQQGRITEVVEAKDRIDAIARDYIAQPANTLIVSPDNRSRQLINEEVRRGLIGTGAIAEDSQRFSTLAHRSDMTGAEREWAARYHPGDIVQFTKGSKAHGLMKDSYAVVLSVDARANTMTVQRDDGQSVTYDPKRLRGVNVYVEQQRDVATGDRIQFTAADKQLGVANRDLGTVTRLDSGQITVALDGKTPRAVTFDPATMRHFDHGYAVTSHSSQGLTEGRVLANIDTDSARSLINSRLAYVAISRASHDARIYTNNAETLGARLATEVSKSSAIDFGHPVRQAQSPNAPAAPSIRQYADPNHRLAAVAADYLERPHSTVILAPDRAERQELNQLIRTDLQARGMISPDSRSTTVLIKQTLSDARLASQYTPGDLIHFRQGSKDGSIASDSTAVVVAIHAATNQITVQTAVGERLIYDPQHAKGVTTQSAVYRAEQREIAVGERIQIAEADAQQGIRRGDFATVTRMHENNALDVRLDNGKSAALDSAQARRIDHGYAVESARPKTTERVLISQEAIAPGDRRELVALANGAKEMSLYTSDGSSLKPAAAADLAPTIQQAQAPETVQILEAPEIQHSRGMRH
jgi:conjugative relaxase-like TrwC/TraI family protein